MMIVVCGLSKCGKSSLIKQAWDSGLRIQSVKASQLLRSSGRPTQALTATEALGNQPELKNLLKDHLREGQPIILDGHLLIETVDGPQLVPESALAPMGLIGIIVVTAPSEAVSVRRSGTKFTVDIDEIQDLAIIENAQARRFARAVGVPFFHIQFFDVAAFVGAVTECIRKADAGCR